MNIKELKKRKEKLLQEREKKLDKIEQLNDALDIIENDLRWTIYEIKKLEKENKNE